MHAINLSNGTVLRENGIAVKKRHIAKKKKHRTDFDSQPFLSWFSSIEHTKISAAGIKR